MPASFCRTPGDAVVVANSGHNRFVANMEQQTANAVVGSLHDDGDVVAAASMPQLEIRASFFFVVATSCFGEQNAPKSSFVCSGNVRFLRAPNRWNPVAPGIFEGQLDSTCFGFQSCPRNRVIFWTALGDFFSPTTTIL